MKLKRTDLHEYQNYSVQFIKDHPTAAIVLDCGLGKTVTSLTAIDDMLHDTFEISKVLVICPLRVCDVWKDEIEKWEHLSGLTCSIVRGTPAERLSALKADADIYIVNRENLQWLVEKSGKPFDYDMCVLDELSSFKNWQSKRFKAFMKVRPLLKRVIGLTGTPSSNGLMDLFAEYRCLDMGERLGRFIGQYRTAFFRPDRCNGPIVYSYKPLPGAEDEIYRRISDITISMRSTDYLKMPDLIESVHEVEMDTSEAKHYEDMKKDLILQLPEGEVTAANAASLSNKLCQMANGAVYADDGTVTEIHDNKLNALEDIIEAANSSPVLVAYWFKHDYDRIEKKLKELGVTFAKIDTNESIRKWNNRELQVGLLHPAAVGHGVNLQSGGNIIVWFSQIWSLELYEQSVDRLYRQGQKSGTVSVIHIVTKDTIDERIAKALKQKDATQSALIDAVKAVLR